MGVYRVDDIYRRETDVRAVRLQLLVVPCKIVYKCFLGIPFVVALDVVASPVHLYLKFHNLHDERVSINADLEGAKRIYQALQQNKGESKAT